MLQFITCNSDRYSTAEQVQMALEGGCQWIQISALAQKADDFGDQIKTIIDMCRQAGAFLLLSDDVELCDKLRVHGVHLVPGDMTPREAREHLGGHAVIGVSVTTAAEVIALRCADIDYVHVGPFGTRFGFDEYAAIVAELNEAGVDTPVVATGDIPDEIIARLLEAGVRGVALSATLMDNDDPVAAVKRILAIRN